jgi:hypothetical protein
MMTGKKPPTGAKEKGNDALKRLFAAGRSEQNETREEKKNLKKKFLEADRLLSFVLAQVQRIARSRSQACRTMNLCGGTW